MRSFIIILLFALGCGSKNGQHGPVAEASDTSLPSDNVQVEQVVLRGLLAVIKYDTVSLLPDADLKSDFCLKAGLVLGRADSVGRILESVKYGNNFEKIKIGGQNIQFLGSGASCADAASNLNRLLSEVEVLIDELRKN